MNSHTDSSESDQSSHDQVWDRNWKERRWSQALNLLLNGTGYMLKFNKKHHDDEKASGSDGLVHRLKTQGPFFREFMPGDYELLHNDCVHSRMLSITGWCGSLDWQPEWGGNNLWCGMPETTVSSGALEFVDAIKNPPVFNRAGLILPQLGAYHAVEPVTMLKPVDKHRFSWTFWTSIPDLETSGRREGGYEHWETRMNQIGYELGDTVTQIDI